MYNVGTIGILTSCKRITYQTIQNPPMIKFDTLIYTEMELNKTILKINIIINTMFLNTRTLNKYFINCSHMSINRYYFL